MNSTPTRGTHCRRSPSPARRVTRACHAILAVGAVLSMSGAFAALGAPATSIATDRQAIEAQPVSTTSLPAFERHEMVMPSGTSVREYASPVTGVFAVDFSGPTMPDLKTLLGTHYDDYVAAARARRGINRHFFSFEGNGLVVRIVKLPRGFEGRAHLPAAVPAGVDMNALQ